MRYYFICGFQLQIKLLNNTFRIIAFVNLPWRDDGLKLFYFVGLES